MNALNPKKPCVSIIMPTYNRSDLICESIESVVTQTYTDWELVIVDDGSSDDTAHVVHHYLQDARVSYVWQENRGQANARNHGIRKARGDFICFLDSDNVWLPTKLEDQVKILRGTPSVDVVYGEGELIDELGNSLGHWTMTRHSGDITIPLLFDNFVTMNTVMMRRNMLIDIGMFDESVRFGDDYDLWLRISVLAKFHYEDVIWEKYRVMPNQISSNKSARFESNWATINRFLENNPEIDSPNLRRRVHSFFYVRRGRTYLGNDNVPAAAMDALRAIRVLPVSVNAWRFAAKLAASVIGIRD